MKSIAVKHNDRGGPNNLSFWLRFRTKPVIPKGLIYQSGSFPASEIVGGRLTVDAMKV